MGLIAGAPLHAQSVGVPLHAQSAGEPLPPNPFAVFESFRLPNGLKVWYGHLPGSGTTSLAVSVPYGRDSDPRGREQTAHLLEHLLLGDRHGRTEAELVRELTRRGGTHNGVTGHSFTQYLVSIGSDEAAYAVHWLHDVVSPRLFSEDLVERTRQPVAIELGARGPLPLPAAAAAYLTHPRLRPAAFWRREFGFDAQEERGADQLAGLAAITAADLRAFHDTFYTPSAMTLVIVTGVPRSILQPVLDSTFATMPWRPAAVGAAVARPRTTESRSFTWHPGTDARLTLRYRVGDLTGRDQLRLIFIEDLLRHRLMERLRRGDDKLVYSVATGTVIRGQAGFFVIRADMGAAHEEMARAIIAHELDRLALAAADTASFYADRDALSRRIRIENASPGALRQWATDRFQHRDLHDAFPDVGEYYATVGPDSIAAFAARLFTRDNRILHVARPLPLAPWVILLAAAASTALAARLYRRLTLRPADMGAIRYIARLRPPLPSRIVSMVTVAAVLLLAARLLAAAIHIIGAEWLLAIDSFALHAAAASALLFTLTLAGLFTAGLVHRKVLVFAHEVRLKAATCRATIIPAAGIRGARLVHGTSDLRLRTPVVPPIGQAVFLELVDGSGYLLRTRSPDRLLAALTSLVEDNRKASERLSAAVPRATFPPAAPSPAPVPVSTT